MKTDRCLFLLIPAIALCLLGCQSAPSKSQNGSPDSLKGDPAEKLSIERSSPFPGAVAAAMAYLDSTGILLEDFYNGEVPDYVPAFRADENGSGPGVVFRFRHYDGVVEMYPLDSTAAGKYYVAHLLGPMPGECHFLLIREWKEAFRVVSDYSYGDKMQEITDKPKVEIRPVLRNDRNNLVYRRTNSVTCRWSETVTVLEVTGDSLRAVLDFREFSNEGPCYRHADLPGQRSMDTMYYDIVRDWEPRDLDKDGINEVTVSGYVNVAETPLDDAWRFQEIWRWNDSLRAYTPDGPFHWHIDSLGRFQPFAEN